MKWYENFHLKMNQLVNARCIWSHWLGWVTFIHDGLQGEEELSGQNGHLASIHSLRIPKSSSICDKIFLISRRDLPRFVMLHIPLCLTKSKHILHKLRKCIEHQDWHTEYINEWKCTECKVVHNFFFFFFCAWSFTAQNSLGFEYIKLNIWECTKSQLW